MKILLVVVLLMIPINAQEDASKVNIELLQKQIQQLQQQLQQTQAPQRAIEAKNFINQRIKDGKKELEEICKAHNAKWIVTFIIIDNKTVINNGCVGK